MQKKTTDNEDMLKEFDVLREDLTQAMIQVRSKLLAEDYSTALQQLGYIAKTCTDVYVSFADMLKVQTNEEEKSA